MQEREWQFVVIIFVQFKGGLVNKKYGQFPQKQGGRQKTWTQTQVGAQMWKAMKYSMSDKADLQRRKVRKNTIYFNTFKIFNPKRCWDVHSDNEIIGIS